MRILVAHGWLHSSRTYTSFKEKLESEIKCQVYLYEFPGFGETMCEYHKDILNNYSNSFINYILDIKPDIIIGHSMGGTVILKSLNSIPEHIKVVLISPVYKGLPKLKPLVIFKPMFKKILTVLKRPYNITNIILKLISLLTINKWHLIDSSVIEDIRKADIDTAVDTLCELTCSNFKVSNYPIKKILIITSENDRVVSNKSINLLKRDLIYYYYNEIETIGHTAVIEDCETLVKYIIDFVNSDSN